MARPPTDRLPDEIVSRLQAPQPHQRVRFNADGKDMVFYIMEVEHCIHGDLYYKEIRGYWLDENDREPLDEQG